jgi:hypothetical protein
MRKAIGFVIVLYAITKIADSGFESFEKALVATFGLVETSANVSKVRLEEQIAE